MSVRIHLLSSILSLSLLFSLPTISVGQDQDETATKFGKYAIVELNADLSHLSSNQRKMIGHLIEAAKQMDSVFWKQAYGDKRKLLTGISDKDLRRFAEINYGPWDRLAENKSFIEGVESKRPGAEFYPNDLSKEEFESFIEKNPDQAETFKSLYTLIQRSSEGGLVSVPYHQAYAEETAKTVEHLLKAAVLAEDDGFKAYLAARAAALLTDDYQHSDMLWMDMKDNMIDVVIGPIENYEDQLFGYKAAHECFVLIKDMAWSARLAKYAQLLPELQEGMPVEEKYKQEKPGMNADLNAYDVVYYAGDCNAGSKTIAINLPNDEEVQLKKGSRRLQLKNAMRAKFDKILVPISETLVVEDQRKHITFNAFFSNTMFHEVAHGLGIKYTIGDDKVAVRDALKETYSALEEGKADILGLYMVTQLYESGELADGQLMDYYVTFMAGIFRSVRFGATSAHGKANMIRFNYFEEKQAFTKDENGQYRCDFEKMKEAMASLSQKILQIQGDGDYDVAKKFVDDNGFIPPNLQVDLERLSILGIPVDIVFEQGANVLGLDK